MQSRMPRIASNKCPGPVKTYLEVIGTNLAGTLVTKPACRAYLEVVGSNLAATLSEKSKSKCTRTASPLASLDSWCEGGPKACRKSVSRASILLFSFHD